MLLKSAAVSVSREPIYVDSTKRYGSCARNSRGKYTRQVRRLASSAPCVRPARCSPFKSAASAARAVLSGRNSSLAPTCRCLPLQTPSPPTPVYSVATWSLDGSGNVTAVTASTTPILSAHRLAGAVLRARPQRTPPRLCEQLAHGRPYRPGPHTTGSPPRAPVRGICDGTRSVRPVVKATCMWRAAELVLRATDRRFALGGVRVGGG